MSNQENHKSHLPFEAELIHSPAKKYNEVIVLVPFYGGRKPAMKRHAEFLNGIGYDVVLFNLLKEKRSFEQTLFSSQALLGMKHIWADQIEAVLNSIPGKKILFAFSNPGASAIEATVRRNAYDIKGLVCDSGPSSNLLSSMVKYFTHEEPIRFLPFKYLAAMAITTFWAPQFKEVIHEDIRKLPEHFRILSIRGWKDKLISPTEIDGVFESHDQIDWQKLSLPLAGHLNGLRDFPEEYNPKVTQFLKSISTEINY